MSEIEKHKKVGNNITYFKIKKDIENKSNRNNHLIIKKNTNMLNIDKIISKGNFSFSRNRKTKQKNILVDDLLSKKINDKKLGEDISKNHKKNLTNIYNAESSVLNPEFYPEFKKLTEKKLFENKKHRRIQTERQSIELKDKKINKTGNRHVLLNSRNLKKNNGFTTEYLFEGKNDNTYINHHTINSTYINLTLNKSYKKNNYIQKLNPSIAYTTIENKVKNNSNNFCLKSCNLEKNQYSKKKKIYPIKRRNKIVDNIFKTQTKVRNNYNYYSQDNSISNIKSANLKKKTENISKFPKKRIYLSTQIRESFELSKKDNLFSNSNITIKSYTNSFDDEIKSKLFNTQKNNYQNQYISNVQKKDSEIIIEKPHKKKSSNFNLKKIFPNKIQNIFKDNLFQSNNLIFIKDKKLVFNTNSKSSEPKSITNKNIYKTNLNSIKQFEYDNNNKSKQKNQKSLKKNNVLKTYY